VEDSKVKTMRLPMSGVEISRIGLGCATFGRETDEYDSFRILDYAFEHGIRLLDTAEAYGGGQARLNREKSLGIQDIRETTGEMHSSEKIIGRWLRSTGLRSQVVIQTKILNDFSQAHVAAALEQSLERLQSDYVDIYLLHHYDKKTSLETTVEAMDAAVRSRKTLSVGCSNFDASQLKSALELARERKLARFEVIQPIYNLVDRQIEAELLGLSTREQVATVVYSPLAAGFLTGKYRAEAGVPKGTRFDVIPSYSNSYFNESNFKLLEHLRALAERTGLSMARLAMSWVFSNPAVQCVLIGARTVEQIDNAIASHDGLPPALVEEMNSWSFR